MLKAQVRREPGGPGKCLQLLRERGLEVRADLGPKPLKGAWDPASHGDSLSGACGIQHRLSGVGPPPPHAVSPGERQADMGGASGDVAEGPLSSELHPCALGLAEEDPT